MAVILGSLFYSIGLFVYSHTDDTLINYSFIVCLEIW